MESPERGALGLVRLVAICLLALGLLDATLYFTQYLMPLVNAHNHHTQDQPAAPLNILRVILDAIPVIIGIAVLIKAKAIAEWLSELIQ
jgi:hypothetical protein